MYDMLTGNDLVSDRSYREGQCMHTDCYVDARVAQDLNSRSRDETGTEKESFPGASLALEGHLLTERLVLLG